MLLTQTRNNIKTLQVEIDRLRKAEKWLSSLISPNGSGESKSPQKRLGHGVPKKLTCKVLKTFGSLDLIEIGTKITEVYGTVISANTIRSTMRKMMTAGDLKKEDDGKFTLLRDDPDLLNNDEET